MTATFSAGVSAGRATRHAPGRRPQPRRDQEGWQLADASHELRTPLTALRTEVELALLGDREASDLRAALTSAAEEIRRVCRLADDILVLARADHGRLPLRPGPLEPGRLLEAAAARARPAAWLQGRQIVVGDFTPGCWLFGDPDRIAQALDNLVSNALHHGSGMISLTARDEGKLLGLHVTDQGSGFAEDVAERAFHRFIRGKGTRAPGSGLGLSLVAAIADAHRGEATIGNSAAGGADTCIALPWCVPAELSPAHATWLGEPEPVHDEGHRASPAAATVFGRPAVRRPAAKRSTVPCRRHQGNRVLAAGSSARHLVTSGPARAKHSDRKPLA